MPEFSSTRVQASQVEALQEVSLLLSRRIRKYSGTDLTLSQLSALSTLQRGGAMRIGELARRELVNKSSVTRLVAKLESMGYIARDIDPRDGRSSQVAITAHGHDLLAESRRRASELLIGEVERLSDVHRAALLGALPALQALVAPKR